MSNTVRKRRRIRVTTDVVANYFDLFNDETEGFLMPDFWVDEEMAKSKVHVDSKVYALEEEKFVDQMISNEYDSSDDSGNDEVDDDDEEEDEDESEEKSIDYELGSLWTRMEKEKFFYCLSRYSIHRLDEWHLILPNKTKYEILVYYQVLRTNLRRLQSAQRRKNKLLTQIMFPIAYEMSPEFIRLEEAFAQQINDISRKEDREEPDRKAKGLIAYDNWYKRWKPLYANTKIDEITPIATDPLQYDPHAQRYLTQLVKRYTRQLLWYSLLPTLEIKSISKRKVLRHVGDGESHGEEDNDDIVVYRKKKKHKGSVYPHVVTREDVSRAAITMKQENPRYLTLGEQVVDTFRKYEIEHDAGKMFQNKEIATQSVLPKLIEHDTLLRQATTRRTVEHDRDHYHEHEHHTRTDDVSEKERKYYRKIYRLMLNKAPEELTETTTFVEHRAQDVLLLANSALDNPVDIELHREYAEFCDAHDMALSRQHENMVLRHFTRLGARSVDCYDSASTPSSKSKSKSTSPSTSPSTSTFTSTSTSTSTSPPPDAANNGTPTFTSATGLQSNLLKWFQTTST
ncbi:RNA polymerase I-specific transcription initiation factor RRN5 [Nakaseomyces bracarensis]|uniref:RNA polymerase I-specific transcription initiation factor RRN5 n=1 Tax=Nakaseomyces bracarensis TaxID=273131 RepID=A0ABR4NRT2_9SACH